MKKLLFRLAVSLLTFIISLIATTIVARPIAEKATRESVLKQSLRDMRKAIDQYAADKEHLPQSLTILVDEGYILKIPVDPITNADDWMIEVEEDTISRNDGRGITTVYSNSPDAGLDGIPYSEY